jgi:hypothetical protein
MGKDSCQDSTSKGSTKSLLDRGRKLYAICEFNLIEKRVRGNTAIPLDVNKLTPQVIDDALDGPLGETPDQPLMGPDLFRGATSHAVLAQVDHLRTPPLIQRSAVTSSRSLTGGSSMPRNLFVRNKLSTIFIHLNDGITPAQLRFNVSQLAGNFRLDWITPYKRLV